MAMTGMTREPSNHSRFVCPRPERGRRGSLVDPHRASFLFALPRAAHQPIDKTTYDVRVNSACAFVVGSENSLVSLYHGRKKLYVRRATRCPRPSDQDQHHSTTFSPSITTVACPLNGPCIHTPLVGIQRPLVTFEEWIDSRCKP